MVCNFLQVRPRKLDQLSKTIVDLTAQKARADSQIESTDADFIRLETKCLMAKEHQDPSRAELLKYAEVCREGSRLAGKRAGWAQDALAANEKIILAYEDYLAISEVVF